MNTDLPKPPLAPKPSLGHVAPLTLGSQPSSPVLRLGLHQNTNPMSRGPKPPLAPKPVLLLTTEGRSSVYINNSLNNCPNGEMIGYDACLTAEELEDAQHQCKCLELSADRVFLDSPEPDDTQQENSVDSDGLIQTPVIMGEGDHDSSDVAELVDPGSDISTGTEGRGSTETLPEMFLSEAHAEDSPFENEDQAVDFENDDSEDDVTVSVKEAPCGLDLVKGNNEHNLENYAVLDVENDFSRNICDKDIVRLIPLDEHMPDFQESKEEEDLNPILEADITSNITEDYSKNEEALSDANSDSLLEQENDFVIDNTLENCSSFGVCPHDGETDIALEIADDVPHHAETCSGESQNEACIDDVDGASEKDNPEAADSETDRNMEQEDNVDDGYETIEIKSEEELSEAAHDEGEVSKEDDAVKDDSLDDSCQIIPFENDCNEDLLDVPHGYLDDFLNVERAHLCDESSVPEPTTEADMTFVLERNGVSECILEEEYEDGESESDGQLFAEGTPSPKEGEQGDYSTEEGDGKPDDEATVGDGELPAQMGESPLSEVRAHYECKSDSTDCVSLTDEEENPYVLESSLHSRGENSLCGERIVLGRTADGMLSDYDLSVENDNLLSVDRKNIVTRARSLSGKVTGCVPETVPEETGPESDSQSTTNDSLVEDSNYLQYSEGKHSEINRLLPAKPRRFILYPRSYSVEGRESPISVYRESEENSIIRRREDNISLPSVLGSSGSFSQRNHPSSSGVSVPSSGVDIPPPFELASITKKPITKSSPSLLIESESPDKYFKKKKSSFKRFLTLKFRKKTENKIHVDVNVSSSRSSSESSYHGPSRVLEIDRRSLGSSPQLKSRSGKMRACDSPSAVLFYKDGKRKGTPKAFRGSVARVESFEDRSRPPFMPLPLTKPRSISFPNADTSDYENIPAMSSDYENIQIPPRRPARAGTFTEFFEDPSRALASANENDGYVDMSSFTTFEMKQQTQDQDDERYCKRLCKTC